MGCLLHPTISEFRRSVATLGLGPSTRAGGPRPCHRSVTSPVPGPRHRVTGVTAASQSPVQSLQHTEARARFDLLDIDAYDVRLDLAADDATFGSVTTIRFTSRGWPDVRRPQAGARQPDPAQRRRASTPTSCSAGGCRSRRWRVPNELVVDAVMRFRNDGEGLHAQRRPGRRPALRLRHVVHGRGAEHLRLLRPARPQGALHLPRDRAGRLAGRRQRPRHQGRDRSRTPHSGSSTRPSRCRRTS